MKQKVNPVVIVACVVVGLAALVYFGVKAMSPPAPVDAPKSALGGGVSGGASGTAASAPAQRPTQINGQDVPKNVPVDYMQKPVEGRGQ